MKQKAFGAALSGRFDSAAALICFLFFVFGSAVGTFSGSSLSSSAMVVVNSVQRGLFGYINGFSFLFRFVGFSIFCFIVLYISSLCVAGFIFILPIFFIKGFSLSYSCAALISLAGEDYIVPLVFYTLCDIVICIPVLFYCGIFSARYSLSLTRSVFSSQRSRVYNSLYFKCFGFGAAAFILAGLFQRFIIPIFPVFHRLHI